MPEENIIPVRIGEVILYSKALVLVKLMPDNEIGVEDVKEQIVAAEKLTKGSRFVVVLDGGLTLDVKDGAMTYAAKHQNEKWLAFAIIVRSLSERLFANYYLRFKKPIRPTKVFTTPKGAEEWLKQFTPIDIPLNYKI
jgi:hypothetical protein